MSSNKSMLRDIKKLKQSIQPPQESMITIYFLTLGEAYQMTVKEFEAAEKSAWNGTPNEIASKFMRYLEEGHIDDAGLVCFFFKTDNLWDDDWEKINQEKEGVI